MFISTPTLCPQRIEESVEFPGTEAANGMELNPGPLQDSQCSSVLSHLSRPSLSFVVELKYLLSSKWPSSQGYYNLYLTHFKLFTDRVLSTLPMNNILYKSH